MLGKKMKKCNVARRVEVFGVLTGVVERDMYEVEDCGTFA